MIFADLVLIVVGAALTVVGYLIRMKRKYRLINGWEQSQRPDKVRMADRLGLAELVVGAGWMALGVIGLFVQSGVYSGVSLAVGVIGLLAGLWAAVR